MVPLESITTVETHFFLPLFIIVPLSTGILFWYLQKERKIAAKPLYDPSFRVAAPTFEIVLGAFVVFTMLLTSLATLPVFTNSGNMLSVHNEAVEKLENTYDITIPPSEGQPEPLPILSDDLEDGLELPVVFFHEDISHQGVLAIKDAKASLLVKAEGSGELVEFEG